MKKSELKSIIRECIEELNEAKDESYYVVHPPKGDEKLVISLGKSAGFEVIGVGKKNPLKLRGSGSFSKFKSSLKKELPNKAWTIKKMQ